MALLLLVALVAPLAGPGRAAYAGGTIVVNTTADTPDASPGDGICADAGGDCSLRAAIEESNARAGYSDVLVPDGTYVIGAPLVIDGDMGLRGGGKGETIIDGDLSTRLFHIRTTELLVCDVSDDSIASFGRNGHPNPDFISAGQDGLSGPTAIAVDPRQEYDVFVVADSGVHRYADDGHSEGLFLDPALALLADFAPSDGIFGPSETFFHFFVADYFPNNRILQAEPVGGGVATLIPDGAGGLAQPNNLAFFEGDLYVTSASTSQVLRYDGKTGDFISVFVDGQLSTPRGLAFRGGSLYVSDEGNDRVMRFNALTGASEGAFVAPGAGGLDKPTDLAFGPDGHLYVISHGTHDILSYDGETGAFRGVFAAGGENGLGIPGCLEWRMGDGNGPGVNFWNMTLRNGRALDVGGLSAGLTIDHGAAVVLHRVSVEYNESSIMGGGIRNYGSLTMTESEVKYNKLPDGGGGQTSVGGGIFNDGELTIRRSLIADNFATRGGGIANQGRLSLFNSTVSGNIAIGGGAGIRNVGDGVVNINASTITDNRARELSQNGDADPYDFGGGIFNYEPARVYMANSILAGNTDNRSRGQPDQSPDCYSNTRGGFVSYGDNLFGILTEHCAVHDTSYDQVGTAEAPFDPQLEPLINNGGPTATHKLKAGSPAIDADTIQAGDAFFNCPTVDQRFSPRPQGRACDIGAFELVQGAGGTISQPGDLAVQPPTTHGEAGIRATLTRAAPRRGDVRLAFATSDQSPIPVPVKTVGGRFIELDLTGADSRDALKVTFYYPSVVSAADERAPGFQLLYFADGAWRPVRGSDGAAPALDPADNADGSVSGGRFTLTFDRSSSPRISELRRAVFTTAIIP